MYLVTACWPALPDPCYQEQKPGVLRSGAADDGAAGVGVGGRLLQVLEERMMMLLLLHLQQGVIMVVGLCVLLKTVMFFYIPCCNFFYLPCVFCGK